MTDTRISAQSAAGTIYDLGYRHYEGTRRGRGYAFWSLFVESMRSVFGFGRPFRSKAAPFILIGLYSMGAVFQIGVLALMQNFGQSSDESMVNLYRYDNYFDGWNLFLVLFCVAQAPELLARDQRYRILPLYFTRAITRTDYAVARLLALTTSLFIALLVPMAGLFGGRTFLSQDAIKGLQDQLPYVIPGLASSALIAFTMASIALAISAFSPRRAYCAISMIAYFILVENIPNAIFAIGEHSDWGWTSPLLLIRPLGALIQATDWFFGKFRDEFPGFLNKPTVTSDQFVLSAIAMAVVAATIVLLRYRRMPA